MLDLTLGSLPEAERLLAQGSEWAGVLSLGDPGQAPPGGLASCRRHLRREFHDVDARLRGSSKLQGPAEADVVAILEFFAGTPDGPILVHCGSGISRSTASAYVGVCQALGPGRDREALAVILRARPQALPNRLIVGLADAVMGRKGEMQGVVEEHLGAWRREGTARAKATTA